MLDPSGDNQSLPQVNAVTNIQPAVGKQPPPAPVPSSPAPTYAGLYVRYAASVIDSLVLGIPSALLSFAVGLFFKFLNLPTSISEILPRLVAICVILPVTVYMVITKGATPGKLFFNLKIVDQTGNLPNLKKAILREVVGKFILGAFTFGLVSIVSFFMVVFGSRKQAVHDKIAGTYVLLIAPLTSFKKFVVFFVTILFPLAIIGILTAIVLIAINPAGRLGQAKDAKRKADIGSIATSLQAYQTINKKFPSDLQSLVSSGNLREVPKDPKGSAYTYSVDSNGSSVALFAKLEKENGLWCWQSETNRPRLVSSERDCRP